MHLFDLKEEENEGLAEIVSDLALNVLYLIILASSMLFVQEGSKPHFRS
jgi:hypothetical protein